MEKDNNSIAQQEHNCRCGQDADPGGGCRCAELSGEPCGCGHEVPDEARIDPEQDDTAGIDAEGDLDPLELKRLLEESTARAEDYYQRLLRLQADFENFRKRTVKEREDLLKYAGERLITELLPIMDNFDLALAHKDQDPAKVAEGIGMIHRQIHDLLGREGLAPIAAVGEPFDPSKHEAVMQEEAPGQPDNTVLEELRRGYSLRDKVIRPAMVKVARSS